MKFKRITKTLQKNFYIPVFLICIFFVGVFVVGKSVFSEPSYVYVKVKVGQGLWWAASGKPSSWYSSSIKKGYAKYDLLGNKEAEVLEVRKYPTFNSSMYDVFLIVKLKVAINGKTQSYTYNRSTLSISSPIELQFPKVNITGTIIDVSATSIENTYVEKTIVLIYPSGYTPDLHYRYDSIAIGDKYFDGTNTILEITDKSLIKTILPIPNNLTGEIYDREIESTQTIVVKVKAKLLKKVDGLYFGEDYKMVVNSQVPIATDNYFFDGFLIQSVE